MRHAPLHCLLFSGLAMAASGIAVSQSGGAMPSNAHASRYDGGWECARGFQKVSEACVAIDIPDNAYLAPSGVRWQCERGFVRKDEQCVAVTVPANAYADDALQVKAGNAIGAFGRLAYVEPHLWMYPVVLADGTVVSPCRRAEPCPSGEHRP